MVPARNLSAIAKVLFAFGVSTPSELRPPTIRFTVSMNHRGFSDAQKDCSR